jgi:hypothetical protein
LGGRAVSGTSEAGIVTPMRPGEDKSKMVGSTIFAAATFSGVSIMAHLRQHFNERVNFFLAVHLGHHINMSLSAG